VLCNCVNEKNLTVYTIL